MKIFILVLMTAFIQGCSSITTHEGAFMDPAPPDEPRYLSSTPIYGGVINDFQMIGDCLFSPFSDPVIICIPFPVIDLPLSLIADTFYLPSDIEFKPRWKEYQKNKSNQRVDPTVKTPVESGDD